MNGESSASPFMLSRGAYGGSLVLSLVGCVASLPGHGLGLDTDTESGSKVR